MQCMKEALFELLSIRYTAIYDQSLSYRDAQSLLSLLPPLPSSALYSNLQSSDCWISSSRNPLSHLSNHLFNIPIRGHRHIVRHWIYYLQHPHLSLIKTAVPCYNNLVGQTVVAVVWQISDSDAAVSLIRVTHHIFTSVYFQCLFLLFFRN